MSIAHSWYEKTRNMAAFNITDHALIHANQHSKEYRFCDGSRLYIHKTRNTIAYSNLGDECLGERVLWQSYGG